MIWKIKLFRSQLQCFTLDGGFDGHCFIKTQSFVVTAGLNAYTQDHGTPYTREGYGTACAVVNQLSTSCELDNFIPFKNIFLLCKSQFYSWLTTAYTVP